MVLCAGRGVALTLPSQDLVTALLLAQAADCAVADSDRRGGQRPWRCLFRAVSPTACCRALERAPVGPGAAVVRTLLALVLPMHSLEPFLLLLSSVFVPLFGVILGRLAFGADTAAAQQRR